MNTLKQAKEAAMEGFQKAKEGFRKAKEGFIETRKQWYLTKAELQDIEEKRAQRRRAAEEKQRLEEEEIRANRLSAIRSHVPTAREQEFTNSMDGFVKVHKPYGYGGNHPGGKRRKSRLCKSKKRANKKSRKTRRR